MKRFTQDLEPVAWIAPAILGAVLGLLFYQASSAQSGSLVVALLCVLGGVCLVSLSAYGIRRILPSYGNKTKEES
jgi:hypothetical protein